MNPDNDKRGDWKTADLSARNPYSAGTYSMTISGGRVIDKPPTGRYWAPLRKKALVAARRQADWWGADQNAIPQQKTFLKEVKQGVVPQTLWFYKDVGHAQEAKKELPETVDFADSALVFITPKPTRRMKRIFEIASEPGDLVMDSFAGAGTTGSPSPAKEVVGNSF